MKEKERYDLAQSIYRHIKGVANNADIRLIENWKHSSENNILLFEKISGYDFLNEIIAELQEYDSRKAHTRFLKRRRNTSLMRRMRNIAAVALPLLALGSLIFLPKGRELHKPADNAIILTLSDDQEIILNGDSMNELSDQGTIFTEYGELINYAGSGSEIIVDTNKEDHTKPVSLTLPVPGGHVGSIYHTLTVPTGKEYTIILSDGSSVKLNARSKLKYPVPFAGDKREVTMTGEAYFKVSPDSDKPFIVKTPDYDIRVTGTEFNVRSYLENETATTLVSGSVQIEKNNKTYDIAPGQQAVITAEGISVNEVSIERYVAWEQGEFLFSHEPLSAILSEISEWYGLDEVVFDGEGVNELLFSAGFRRSAPIEEILDILQSTGIVKFKLSNGRLKVMYR